MPWKETCVMDERMRFIIRLKDGESMSELCREFGISRKTGYKISRRYELEGLNALENRSSRPENLANLTDPKIKKLIVEMREKRPTWGAKKIIARLHKDHHNLHFPSRITAHAILVRHGLVKSKKKRLRARLSGTERSQSQKPNDLWCADHKGQYLLRNGRLCYPLTISDHYSRFLFALEALESTKGALAKPVFEMVFEEHGLPNTILSDNGPPFASSKSIFALSKMSVWWMRLGIRVERIDPGHPEQNGRHERIHLNVQNEVVPKAEADLLLEQEHLENWRKDYNVRRPHEALENKTPSEVYRPSERAYKRELPEFAYPTADTVIGVNRTGHTNFLGTSFFISEALAGQLLAVKEQEDDSWTLSFMDLELGVIDTHEGIFIRGDI